MEQTSYLIHRKQLLLKSTILLQLLFFSDTDENDIISSSDIVTITANFSEPISGTPIINITGIDLNQPMVQTSSNTIWTYSLQVTSTSVSVVTVNVSATDMAGNDLLNQESYKFCNRQ